jgi:ATP-dependent helicase HrpB
VSEALLGSLGWALAQRLREELPERLEVPSGSQLRLEYRADGAPVLAVKVQEVFGLQTTPLLGRGRLPVVLHLLSPAGRPLQVTSDLASFWSRTWPAVRAEMRTRYPKHHWPEDPARALPSARTTARKLKPDEGSE